MNIFRTFADPIHVDNVPLINITQGTLSQILNISFMVIGGLAVLFLLIGAARYAIAAGDQGALRQAKNTILYAIIGLIVSVSGFAIVQFFLVSVTKG